MNNNDLVELARVRALTKTGQAKALRMLGGLSVGEVARGIGVAPATVWRWEERERVPRGLPALRYAALLESLSQRGRG